MRVTTLICAHKLNILGVLALVFAFVHNKLDELLQRVHFNVNLQPGDTRWMM